MTKVLNKAGQELSRKCGTEGDSSLLSLGKESVLAG